MEPSACEEHLLVNDGEINCVERRLSGQMWECNRGEKVMGEEDRTIAAGVGVAKLSRYSAHVTGRCIVRAVVLADSLSFNNIPSCTWGRYNRCLAITPASRSRKVDSVLKYNVPDDGERSTRHLVEYCACPISKLSYPVCSCVVAAPQIDKFSSQSCAFQHWL